MTPPTPETMIVISKEVWLALVTTVAAPLVASIATNLSLRGVIKDLTDRVTRLEALWPRRAPARARKARK